MSGDQRFRIKPFDLVLLGINSGKTISKARIASLIAIDEARESFLADVAAGIAAGQIEETPDGMLRAPQPRASS